MRTTSTALALLLAASAPRAAAAQPGPDAASQAYETGRQLVEEGRYAEALAAFEQLYSLELSARALFNIAACHELLGQYEQAREKYSGVLALPALPADRRAEVEQAIARVTEAMGLAPTHHSAARQDEDRLAAASRAYATGEQFYRQGRHAEAIQAFQQSYDIVPYPETLFNIAAALEALGRYPDARVRYQAVASLPDVSNDLRAQANAGLARVVQAERHGALPPPGGGLQPHGGLAPATGAGLWERLDTEQDHGGPAGYLFLGGGGCLGGDCSDKSSAGVGGGAGLMWRFIPNLGISAETAFLLYDYEHGYTGGTDTVSTTYLDVAVGLRYHILSSGWIDPWIDVAAGFARWTFDYTALGSGSYAADGALLRAALGCDFFISRYVALGLRFDQRIPIWTSWTDTTGIDISVIEPYDMWMATLNGTFYFLVG